MSKKYVYSSERKLCIPSTKKSSYLAKCITIPCSKNNENTFGLYPGNGGYYTFCSPIGLYVFKCIDEYNEIFDLKTNKCVYNCKVPGLFVDRTSCRDYYSCKRIGGQWQVTKRSCPIHHKFNGDSCVYAPFCIPEIDRHPL